MVRGRFSLSLSLFIRRQSQIWVIAPNTTKIPIQQVCPPLASAASRNVDSSASLIAAISTGFLMWSPCNSFAKVCQLELGRIPYNGTYQLSISKVHIGLRVSTMGREMSISFGITKSHLGKAEMIEYAPKWPNRPNCAIRRPPQ